MANAPIIDLNAIDDAALTAIDAACRDQAPGQQQCGEGLQADTEMPAHDYGNDCGKQFHQRILRRDTRFTATALTSQQQIADHGDVFQRADLMAAVATARARYAEVEALLFGIGRLLEEFEAVATPFALHHHRKAIYYHVQKTANERAEYEQRTEVKSRVQLKLINKLV